jgi:hypothetical protein
VVKTRKPLNLLRLRALEKIFVTNYLVKKAIFRGNCVTKSSRACPTIRPTIRCNTIFCPTMSHNVTQLFGIFLLKNRVQTVPVSYKILLHLIP